MLNTRFMGHRYCVQHANLLLQLWFLKSHLKIFVFPRIVDLHLLTKTNTEAVTGAGDRHHPSMCLAPIAQLVEQLICNQ